MAPEATVFEALEEMAQKRIGALLVMEGERLVGIFSERDYARKVILLGKSSRKTQIREIMSHRVVYADPDLTVDEVMALMTAKRIRHLPVVVEERVVGVISIGDVVRGIIEDQEVHIQELTDYITTG